MKKLKLILLLPFLFCSLYTQAIQINNLTVWPQNPTTNDFISFSVDITANTSPCNPILVDTSFSANQFNFNVQHEQGMLMVICNRTDTYNLGNLPAGTYTLYHRVFQVGGNDSDILVQFTVTEVGGTPSPEFNFSEFGMNSYCMGDTIGFEAIAENFDSLNSFSVNVIRESDGQSTSVPSLITNQDSLWSFSVPVNEINFNAGDAYSVQVESSSPSQLFTDTSVFLIKDIPPAPVWLAADTAFCEGDSIGEFLFNVYNEDYALNWITNPANSVQNMNIVDDAISVEVPDAFTGNFSLALYSTNICGDSELSNELDIEINAKPVVAIIDSGNYIFSVAESGNVNWYINGTPAMGNPTSEIDIEPYITPDLDSIKLKVVYKDENTCEAEDELLVIITDVQERNVIEDFLLVYSGNGYLIIENNYSKPIRNVNIYSVSGQKLFEYQRISSGEKVLLNNLPFHLPGIYILELNINDNNRILKKVHYH
ncbi:MAG: T9SS C-terminal target domain-containing protein [Chitinophagaceae bacterium]|nr:MAG: T9SS C-terminal target domain-containing protein [Chitinophagaceae bacterium]